jgi:hypothetical protein
MHLFLQPIFNCQGTAVAKTNAEPEFAFRFALTARLLTSDPFGRTAFFVSRSLR